MVESVQRRSEVVRNGCRGDLKHIRDSVNKATGIGEKGLGLVVFAECIVGGSRMRLRYEAWCAEWASAMHEKGGDYLFKRQCTTWPGMSTNGARLHRAASSTAIREGH